MYCIVCKKILKKQTACDLKTNMWLCRANSIQILKPNLNLIRTLKSHVKIFLDTR